jgi:hypothetical protein
MLSDADLTWMREALEQTMPDTCVILQPVHTSDGQGGQTTTWGTVTSVRCRIDPGRKELKELVGGAVMAPYSWWQLTLPWDTSIEASYRVVVNGDIYNLLSATENKSWAGTQRVSLVKA